MRHKHRPGLVRWRSLAVFSFCQPRCRRLLVALDYPPRSGFGDCRHRRCGLYRQTGTDPGGFLGIQMPWGRWPWMIHPAGWAIVCNIAICLIFSALARDKAERDRRLAFHAFLAEASSRAPKSRGLRSFAWAAALAWFFFAIGPGLVMGTDLFGAQTPVTELGFSASLRFGPGKSFGGRWASSCFGFWLTNWRCLPRR